MVVGVDDARQAGGGARGDAEVVVWGTGKARREFLHVDDMADACVFLMERYDGSEIVNIGCGQDIEIGEIAQLMKAVVGFDGTIRQDTTKPDGTPRKMLDVSRLASLGWKARTPLETGLRETYDWYRASLTSQPSHPSTAGRALVG